VTDDVGIEEGFDLLLPARRVSTPDALVVAERAEELGWRGLWCSEVLGLDALAVMGAAATRTRLLRLGTAVVPITTRSVTLLAMAASTLAQIAPGRFHLGIGVGTPEVVDRRHDRPVTSPLTESRGALEVLRGTLAGETVDHDELPRVHRLRIEAPAAPPPLLLAALGPRMTELAMSRADGVVLNLLTCDEAATRARRAHDEVGEEFEVTLLVRTCVDPSDADLDAMTRELASYARIDAYARQFRALGFDLDPVHDAPDLDTAARRLPDGMLETIEVIGGPGDCRERLESYRRAGVTPLVLPVGDLEVMFDIAYHTRHVDTIFERVFGRDR